MDTRQSDFTEDQIQRYARHIVLPEVGGTGQRALLSARVLVVGAGGLGSPALLYLAAAGVGHLTVIDPDRVSLDNLQRQVLHATDRVGAPKVESAAERLRALNPDTRIVPIAEPLSAANAAALVADADLVLDGSDSFATRYLVNDACYLADRPLISAAVLRFEGQLAVFGGRRPPCWRCLYPEPPAPGRVPSCAEAGVLGAVAGVLGTLQATAALKRLLGLGGEDEGRLLLYDALGVGLRALAVPPDPRCRLCGPAADIRDLSGHG